MSKEIDGGPAFPSPSDENESGEWGMSLRDYFAAKAMQGILAGQWANADINVRSNDKENAKIAYQAADAMLKASGK